MLINDYIYPDDLFYDRNHFWARPGGNAVAVGIDAFTARLAGEFTYVDLPEVGRLVSQGEAAGSLESGKWVGRIYCPVGGRVARVNGELLERPEILGNDPYGTWILEIEPAGLRPDLERLLAAGPELRRFIEAELARLDV